MLLNEERNFHVFHISKAPKGAKIRTVIHYRGVGSNKVDTGRRATLALDNGWTEVAIMFDKKKWPKEKAEEWMRKNKKIYKGTSFAESFDFNLYENVDYKRKSWAFIEQVVGEVARKKVDVNLKDRSTISDAQRKFKEMRSEVQELMASPPSEEEVFRGAKVVARQLGYTDAEFRRLSNVTESLQESEVDVILMGWEMFVTAIQTAWEVLSNHYIPKKSLLKAGAESLGISKAVPATAYFYMYAISILMGVAFYLSTKTLLNIALGAWDWAGRVIWFKEFKFYQVMWPGMTEEERVALSSIQKGNEYKFAKSVPAFSLDRPGEGHTSFSSAINFEFKGFVKKRFKRIGELPNLLIEPLAGDLSGEDVFVPIQNIVLVQDLNHNFIKDYGNERV